jgi:hypothetical protein
LGALDFFRALVASGFSRKAATGAVRSPESGDYESSSSNGHH